MPLRKASYKSMQVGCLSCGKDFREEMPNYKANTFIKIVTLWDTVADEHSFADVWRSAMENQQSARKHETILISCEADPCRHVQETEIINWAINRNDSIFHNRAMPKKKETSSVYL